MRLEEVKVKRFFEIVKGEQITPVFQPIVELKTGDILSYEALSRITCENNDITIDKLFDMADQLEQAWNLEKICRSKALLAAANKPKGTKIFLNVDANIILDTEFVQGFTTEFLKKYGLDTQDVVFELTERTSVEDRELFQRVVNHYKAQGFEVAIDDAGSGHSNLNRISCVEPQYIKIDMELIRDIHLSKVKKSMVGIITRFCQEMNYTAIAEGIETEEELRELVEMGVTHGQGYLLARPAKGFVPLEPEKKQLLERIQQEIRSLSFVPSFFGNIESICKRGTTMNPEHKALDAYELFAKDMELSEICVVDEEDHFYGIMTRNYILRKFGGMYGYSLHQKYTVGSVMKKDALCVSTGFSVESVSKMAMERLPLELYDAVVVLQGDKYYGIVTIKDLLSTAVTIQVKRATEANPLTSLPGNQSIEHQINQLLGETRQYAIMYLDLDNFKAYNDAYGFNSGDRMICALADAMQCCSGKEDFLGHIGGDDFVIITRNKDAKLLAHEIIGRFQACLENLYNTEDWNRGYIIAKNRVGLTEQFPIASISIAIVTNARQVDTDIESLSKRIAQTKKEAKHKAGYSVVVS